MILGGGMKLTAFPFLFFLYLLHLISIFVVGHDHYGHDVSFPDARRIELK